MAENDKNENNVRDTAHKTSLSATQDNNDKYAYHVRIVDEDGDESRATILTMGKCVSCY